MNEAMFANAATMILERVLSADPTISKDVDFSRSVNRGCDHPMPGMLHTFHSICGRSAEVMSSHHRFLPGDDVQFHHGGLVFCEENERVVYWGIEAAHLEKKDPPVSQWNPTSRAWCFDCPALSHFLLNMICWQLLNAAPVMARGTPGNQLLPSVQKLFRSASDDVQEYDLMSYYSHGVVACFLQPKLFFLGCGSEEVSSDWGRKLNIELEWL
jgi:hypothetical protein